MEEFIAITAIFAVFPSILFSFILRYKKLKLSEGKSSSGEGMRVSELKAMIQEAVGEATAPLIKRIEHLEAIATDPAGDLPRLPEAQSASPLFDEGDAEDEAEPALARSRSRA